MFLFLYLHYKYMYVDVPEQPHLTKRIQWSPLLDMKRKVVDNEGAAGSQVKKVQVIKKD